MDKRLAVCALCRHTEFKHANPFRPLRPFHPLSLFSQPAMKYYQIEISCEPSIIGVNDASAQVEILTKPSRHSFASEQERQYFCDYVAKNEKNLERAYMDSYAAIDSSQTETIRAYKTNFTTPLATKRKSSKTMRIMTNTMVFLDPATIVLKNNQCTYSRTRLYL